MKDKHKKPDYLDVPLGAFDGCGCSSHHCPPHPCPEPPIPPEPENCPPVDAAIYGLVYVQEANPCLDATLVTDMPIMLPDDGPSCGVKLLPYGIQILRDGVYRCQYDVSVLNAGTTGEIETALAVLKHKRREYLLPGSLASATVPGGKAEGHLGGQTMYEFQAGTIIGIVPTYIRSGSKFRVRYASLSVQLIGD